MAIKDYSTTPDMNTSISGINIAEGCAPSGINNAIRQLMADVKAESEAQSSALSSAVSTQSTRDSQQDSAISAAQTAANNAASAASSALISADIEDGELVFTYGNGTTKRVSLPGGLPLGTLMPYTGKDVPAGFLRADGATYSNMRSSFPEFYNWVVNSGLTVSLGSYTLVEGSCGFYGLDTSTGTVRMPTLASGVGGTTAAGQYGAAVQAGLPNIIGEYKSYGTANYSVEATGAFAIKTVASYKSGAWANSASGTKALDFDASRSNSIYGRSTTVQPPHVKYPWVISVYSSAVPASVAQANNFTNLLDGKADKTQIITPKAYITETWSSGTSWYRKYSDGWIEQWGESASFNRDENTPKTVTLHQAFSNMNYNVRVSKHTTSSAATYGVSYTKVSNTQIKLNNNAGMPGSISWYACGY